MATNPTSNQPTEYEQVTYNGPDGAQMGKSSTEKIGFHGATPSAQTTLTTLATAATLATVTASVQEIIAALQAKGLFG